MTINQLNFNTCQITCFSEIIGVGYYILYSLAMHKEIKFSVILSDLDNKMNLSFCQYRTELFLVSSCGIFSHKALGGFASQL